MAVELVCLLLTYIPWLFVLTLPVYIILAAQLYFSEKPLWQKVAASFGPILLWLAALLLWKRFFSLY
ncbi:hypothetical protein HMJ29_02190 [Hymenobacter taeanensis]|uniref:Uncharacterized protein n=1 Tax=Hymenobacter taeanensis TaxID=2735321 RepID=A0A6M6BC79_9BACT|nr:MULTISPECIES: hypothetical protein [Hymenobacter]QJX45806.1 hypothetical protein HMJ29_02190 [Hymenobacter taeanensis]UOQ79650.1 hypothetical protein MUN83_12400 [Hymenobacter sp. 5414T-23]